jgi:hypothetical protein
MCASSTGYDLEFGAAGRRVGVGDSGGDGILLTKWPRDRHVREAVRQQREITGFREPDRLAKSTTR